MAEKKRQPARDGKTVNSTSTTKGTRTHRAATSKTYKSSTAGRYVLSAEEKSRRVVPAKTKGRWTVYATTSRVREVADAIEEDGR